MIIVTLIPIRRNDGSRVPDAELREIEARLWQRFGGVTIEGIVTGHWLEDGRHYQDESLKVRLAIEPERLDEARSVIRQIGRQLDQISMYLEIRTDQVEFLRTNEAD
jgi:hypothetical protein